MDKCIRCGNLAKSGLIYCPMCREDDEDDGEHLFIDCPNCSAMGFHYAGVYQSDDGQYDNIWYCPFCDYTETT